MKETDKKVVYEKLKELLATLKADDLSKEVIEAEVTSDFAIIDRQQRITIELKGKTKHLRFAGIGQAEDSLGVLNLAYFNNKGNLVLKPKLIKELLDEN